MKNRSEFKHGFTNRSYLHGAILKALHGFQEKRAHKSRDMQFFLQNVQNDFLQNDLKIFRMVKSNMKSPEQRAELIQKKATEIKMCHYYWSFLWCNY